MMDRILWLARAFGISASQLAGFFRVAPSSIQKAAQGKRKLHAKGQKFLSDPLFSPYPIEDEMALPIWQDPNQAERQMEMEVRFNKLVLDIGKQSAALETFKKQHKQHHAILHHTRHLPETFGVTERLAEKWWIVAKGHTIEALYGFTLAALRKKELKIALMEAEKLMLEKWIEADKTTAAL